MILSFEDLAKCYRCGSANTVAETVIPTPPSEDIRGQKGEHIVEVRCRECGKIKRDKFEFEIE